MEAILLRKYQSKDTWYPTCSDVSGMLADLERTKCEELPQINYWNQTRLNYKRLRGAQT